MAEDLTARRAATIAASPDLRSAVGHHKAEVERIRARPLPPRQKRAEIAASYLVAAGKVAAAKSAETAAIDQARQRAEEEAFKPPPAERDINQVMAARDARDRARQLTKPAAAHALLDEAQAAGDHSLARAVAQHGHRRGWHDVTAKWAGTQPPEVRGHLDDWAEANHLQSPAGRIGRSMAYQVTQPAEISGMTEPMMRQLATEAAGRYGGPAWS